MAGPGVNRKGNSSNSPVDKNLNSDGNQTPKNKQFNNGDASEPFVSDAMAKNSKQLLYAHIYNYLIHNQHFDTAKKFLQEANLPLSKEIPRNSLNGDKLLNSKMLMNSPDTFLLEWWQSLWALNEYVETTPTDQLMSLRPFNDRIVPILPQAPLQEMAGRMGVRPVSNTRNVAPSNIAQQPPIRHMASPSSAPTPYSANINSFPIVPATNSFHVIPGAAPQSDPSIMQSPNFYQNLDGLDNGKAPFRNTGTFNGPKGRQVKKSSANNKGLDQASDNDLKNTTKSKQSKSSKTTGNSNASSKVMKPSPPVSQQVQANWNKLQQQQQQQQQIRMQYQKMMTMMQQQKQQQHQQQQQQQQHQQQQQLPNHSVLAGQGDPNDMNTPSQQLTPQQYIQQQRAYENIMKSQQYEESLMKD